MPLFTAEEGFLNGTNGSKKPFYNTGTTNTTDLTINLQAKPNQKWTLMAIENGKSIGMNGSGTIRSSTKGTIRRKYSDCYDSNGTKINNPTHPSNCE